LATFIATMSYELDPATEPDARKLLRAELVGRRWLDRFEGLPMPAGTVWIKRAASPQESTDDVHTACGKELEQAVLAVARTGRKIGLVRVWIQATGAGTYGLYKLTR
jgi:hypothetical protein